MQFISTRNKNNRVSAAEAIVYGLAEDGGLFVPEEFPQLSEQDLQGMINMPYPERAAWVLSKFMSDFSYEELTEYTHKAYSRFYTDDPCPLVALDELTYILELWHGPTCAFKDMALSLLPYLMTAAREKVGEKNKTLIMVATSGDTGKAALEGFKDVPNTSIVVFYPSEGVSDMQRLQMQTQEGDNVYVCAIKGNFDDAQSAVKSIFASEEANKALLDKGYVLSSANSINWGRLAPQIAYYISSYVDMLEGGVVNYGDKVNFVVPSGNFGNILAGYYARRMGLPIGRLLCASNCNNVLTDFFTTGVYNINREFFKTMSPSMDILISSNLERLLFEITGRDDNAVSTMMSDLKAKGEYRLDMHAIADNAPEFMAGYADEELTADALANFYDDYDYVADPHTGVAIAVSDTVDNDLPSVIVSTASPFKFPADVYEALSNTIIDDAQTALRKLSGFTGENIPEPLCNLNKKQVRFNDVIDKADIMKTVINSIK